MALAPKTPAVAKTRVQVAPNRTVFLGGSTHPFRPGDEFEVPEAEAERLIGLGHVFDPAKKAAEPAVKPIVSSAAPAEPAKAAPAEAVGPATPAPATGAPAATTTEAAAT